MKRRQTFFRVNFVRCPHLNYFQDYGCQRDNPHTFEKEQPVIDKTVRLSLRTVNHSDLLTFLDKCVEVISRGNVTDVVYLDF